MGQRWGYEGEKMNIPTPRPGLSTQPEDMGAN